MDQPPLRFALYQPDIPQNVGAAIRLSACLGLGMDIIEPCGFPFNDRKIKQAAMDYMTLVNYTRHSSWDRFYEDKEGARVVLMTTKASVPYTDFKFQRGDILLAGRESAGVPDDVHDAVDGRVIIPMHGEARSLNIINASAMILGEALRQITREQ
ncbi:MAG: tRNA (cytidine(34)-2'-O)-methyltransferase [Alphaproteobacteria bacterium]